MSLTLFSIGGVSNWAKFDSSYAPYFGDDVRSLVEQAQPDSEGWRVVDYTFERIEEAQTYVLGMGASVDVIAPEELRTKVLRIATDVVAHYSQRNFTRQQ